MENAADALKLAGWVLIFVVALSFTMNTLTLIKQNIDQISTLADREYLANYSEGVELGGNNSSLFMDLAKYYVDENGVQTYVSSSTKLLISRHCGAESIVTSMYRALKENTRIEINNKNRTTII